MDDRIKIGDHWYVREGAIKEMEEITIDPTFTRGFVVEDDEFCFEFSVIEFDGRIAMPSIEFIDKRPEPWLKPEHWDNANWMKRVVSGDTSAMMELEEYNLTAEGLQVLRLVITLADEKGWLDD